MADMSRRRALLGLVALPLAPLTLTTAAADVQAKVVFLSSEVHPLVLAPGDRRFAVWCKSKAFKVGNDVLPHEVLSARRVALRSAIRGVAR